MVWEEEPRIAQGCGAAAPSWRCAVSASSHFGRFTVHVRKFLSTLFLGAMVFGRGEAHAPQPGPPSRLGKQAASAIRKRLSGQVPSFAVRAGGLDPVSQSDHQSAQHKIRHPGASRDPGRLWIRTASTRAPTRAAAQRRHVLWHLPGVTLTIRPPVRLDRRGLGKRHAAGPFGRQEDRNSLLRRNRCQPPRAFPPSHCLHCKLKKGIT
jgi:hypothetical protein